MATFYTRYCRKNNMGLTSNAVKSIAFLFTLLSIWGWSEANKMKNRYLIEKAKSDSLNLMLSDIKHDTITYRMLTNMEYRTRVHTLTMNISDAELIRLVNNKTR